MFRLDPSGLVTPQQTVAAHLTSHGTWGDLRKPPYMYYIILCVYYVMLCYIYISCYIILYDIILYYTTLNYAILLYIMFILY